MKVHKVELLILDFDDVGDRLKSVIEEVRYPNRCISPIVLDVQTVEIGEWDDNHPLNNRMTSKAECKRLFG